MKGHGQKLTRKQEQAIAALLLEPTIRKAAGVVGIGEATLFRWLQLPDFQQAYREAKRQAVSHAVTQLQQAAVDAVETLLAVAKDTAASPAARVTAARTILEMSLKGVELEDLVARVEELERTAERG